MAKPRREGYLLIDHRFSPGIPPEMANSLGLDPNSIGHDRVFESATVTCCHCNVIVILNPNRKRARGYCSKCDQYVCDNPGCNLECRNFDKFLDQAQEIAAKLSTQGEY